MPAKTLVTFPGRAGDLLWALPTVRAISESYGTPVDLQVAWEFASMVDLLTLQPYLAGVIPDPRWTMAGGWEAPELPTRYDRVIHLGYRRWPELPLPREVEHTAVGEGWLREGVVDLARSWITVRPLPSREVACGWTDCYFELKYGLMELIFDTRIILRPGALRPYPLVAHGSRWETEADYTPTDWLEAARRIAGARVFLGDCSALHVLAVALGVPAVVYEPMEARWNPIFWPLGMDGPQVRCVKGGDGRPTIDARHTADTLREVLGGR